MIESCRLQGKELFANQDVKGALAQNTIALEYVDDELLFQLQGFHLEKAQAVRAPLHLNISACHLHEGNWQDAAKAATDALAVTDPANKDQFAKALFRRAKARKELQQTESALNDLEQALKRCDLTTISCRPNIHVCSMHVGKCSDGL